MKKSVLISSVVAAGSCGLIMIVNVRFVNPWLSHLNPLLVAALVAVPCILAFLLPLVVTGCIGMVKGIVSLPVQVFISVPMAVAVGVASSHIIINNILPSYINVPMSSFEGMLNVNNSDELNSLCFDIFHPNGFKIHSISPPDTNNVSVVLMEKNLKLGFLQRLFGPKKSTCHLRMEVKLLHQEPLASLAHSGPSIIAERPGAQFTLLVTWRAYKNSEQFMRIDGSPYYDQVDFASIFRRMREWEPHP